ncbi:MAG: hypothetical protein Q7U83_00595 [Daejeonella sp.]|nr:hypothetical protein [Daejeonella sp.]
MLDFSGDDLTSQLLTTHPERFLTVTQGGSAGRFRWTARDEDSYEQQALEIERLGFSPSLELFPAARNTPKLTEEEIKIRSEKTLANPNQDRFARAVMIRSYREQTITPCTVAAVGVPTLGIVGSADPLLSELRDL